MKNIFSRTVMVQKYFNPKGAPEALSVAPQAIDASQLLESFKAAEWAQRAEILKQLMDAVNDKEKIIQELAKANESNKNAILGYVNDAINTVENSNLDVAQKEKILIQYRDFRIDFLEAHANLTQNHNNARAGVQAHSMEGQSQAQVATVMENFDSMKDRDLVARLFGLEADFFKSSGFGGIKDIHSFQSMMVAVKHAVDNNMAPPLNRKTWEEIGYNRDGIRFQTSELDRLNRFLWHIQSNPQYQTTLNYVANYGNYNNRQGYTNILQDNQSRRLENMAQNTDTSVRQGADGKLEIQQNNIIEALVGSNDSDYASVGIVDLQAALTSTIKQGYKIENTYQSVTGKTLDLSNANAIRQARMDFRDALEIHMALMKASGVQGAGLNAVLEGKGRQYIDAVKNRLTQWQIKLPEFERKWLSPMQTNILSGVLGAGVAVATGGILILNAGIREEVSAQDIFEKLQTKPELMSRFGNILGGIGNFFLGRNFKLSVGHDDFLKAFEHRILQEAEQVMKIDINTPSEKISHPELKRAFEIAKNGGYISRVEDMENFKKAIIERIIESEAKWVSDYKAIWASINPLFIGGHYDRVVTSKQALGVNENNLTEGRITAEKVDITRFNQVNVSPDSKTFTIANKLPDFYGAIQGEIPVMEKDGNGGFKELSQTTFTFNTPKNLHLNMIINQGRAFYVVEFSDKTEATVTNKQEAVVTKKEDNSASMTAAVNKIADGRESLAQVRSNIGGSIYVMSRDANKYKTFNEALVQAGQQNYTRALELLQSQQNRSQIAKTLYNTYKDNPEGLATALTFSYGSINKNHRGNASQQDYLKAHTDGVMNAENKLAGYDSGLEGEFKNHPEHKPTEASDLLSGQNIAVSVYATPKGGRHRIDNFSGSITVSDKVIPLQNKEIIGKIFDRHTYTNEKILDQMNTFLKGRGQNEITMDVLKNWMVNGTLPNGITEDMVAKWPQFLEARAMVQGNLCANKTEIIGYPILKNQVKPTTPEVDSNANVSVLVGQSTGLADSSVETRQSDVGINTVAAYEHLKRDNTVTPDKPEPTDPNKPTPETNPTPQPGDKIPPKTPDVPKPTTPTQAIEGSTTMTGNTGVSVDAGKIAQNPSAVNKTVDSGTTVINNSTPNVTQNATNVTNVQQGWNFESL